MTGFFLMILLQNMSNVCKRRAGIDNEGSSNGNMPMSYVYDTVNPQVHS